MQCLTLSGWAQPADALSSLTPGVLHYDYSQHATVPEAIDALAQFRNLPMVVGWSLGGWLAVQAIAAGALAPRVLVLVAAPMRFVRHPDFTPAMPEETFHQFRANYHTDPARTSGRFHGLIAKGDKNPRHIISQLDHHPHVLQATRWLPWLDALAERSLHDVTIATPYIDIVHGAGDAIVPMAQITHWQARYPHSRLNLWDNACHAPHLHDTIRYNTLLHHAYALI